nr:tetratricopeptide repeat protein [Klebsiella pneumoniae]
MLELLFLLLPVAAAYGWYMGRRSAQQSKQDDASRLSRDYVAGLTSCSATSRIKPLTCSLIC